MRSSMMILRPIASQWAWSGPHAKNDAVARRSGDRGVCGLRIRESIYRRMGNRIRLKPAAGEARQHTAKNFAAFGRRERERIDTDISVATAIELNDVELDDVLNRGDQNLTPGLGKRAARVLEIGIPYGIENDVRTLSVRELSNSFRHAGRGGVDDLQRSAGVPFVGFISAHDADHLGALPSRELNGRLAHLAIGAQDEDMLAGFGHAAPSEAFDGRHERHSDPGRFFHRDGIGLFDECRHLDHQMGGMASVTPYPEIT